MAGRADRLALIAHTLATESSTLVRTGERTWSLAEHGCIINNNRHQLVHNSLDTDQAIGGDGNPPALEREP